MGKRVIIIGGGISGLAAGAYACMNGYSAVLFEAQAQTGGVLGSWPRDGYIVSPSADWILGSAPPHPLFRVWSELGALRGVALVDQPERIRVEGEDGRQMAVYTDLRKLRKELTSLAPVDRDLLREFVRGVHRCGRIPMRVRASGALPSPLGSIRHAAARLASMPTVNRWGRMSVSEFCRDLDDPFLREALPLGIGRADQPMIHGMLVLAAMSRKTAATPVGGTHQICTAIERRLVKLGGAVHTSSPVDRILVESQRAVGVVLRDGSVHRADHVVSASDGHATVFELLRDVALRTDVRRPFEELCPVPPILLVSIGVRTRLPAVPATASGISFPMAVPLTIDERRFHRLTVHVRAPETGLCPPGTTLFNVAIDSNYERWQRLAADPDAYTAGRTELTSQVISALSQRFPQIDGSVDMVDVMTPDSWQRATSNWRGSLSGWLLTPRSRDIPVPQTIPGIRAFYMVGHWTHPGGGLEAAALSARQAVQEICRADRGRFHTEIV